ncbi:MAG: hypothetical protein JGK17_31635 [Microcoleus sp. PH2017_10_PVI_O_A]|uniref:hypothetical protein n=1 Tax=unclassified Microcoleus TaxID=2642155 RepID=UPI001E0E7635|nr:MULTISPECIES: hypothetical protein [unclassified Microcoleus]MCC3410009.1 hypothetical protein [Microcoleus sp. PH2017_10_PVI_O_A]MCC3482618.1 hypothetical protein [Microcoleus sp. PH2017_12_PCY_D_A]
MYKTPYLKHMTIYFNPATEKYPAKLSIEEKNLTATDIIGIQEMVVSVSPDAVSLCIVLSESSLGIVSKDKNFIPTGKKCNLAFYKSKKQAYSQEEKKYIEVAVSQDENYLFLILRDYFVKNPAEGYAGIIAPWLNPFFWDLINKNTAASSEMAGEIKDKLFELTPLTKLGYLTDEDRTKLAQATVSKESFTTARQETEAEKLAARLAFLQQQLATLDIEFKSLSELALVIPVLPSDIAPAVNLAIEWTFKLIK